MSDYHPLDSSPINIKYKYKLANQEAIFSYRAEKANRYYDVK